MVDQVSQESVNNQGNSNQEASGVDLKDDYSQKIMQIEDTNDEEPVIWDMIKKLVKQKGRAEQVVAVTTDGDQKVTDMCLASVETQKIYGRSPGLEMLVRKKRRAVTHSLQRLEIQKSQDMSSRDVNIQELPDVVPKKENIQKYSDMYWEEYRRQEISKIEDMKAEELGRIGEDLWKMADLKQSDGEELRSSQSVAARIKGQENLKIEEGMSKEIPSGVANSDQDIPVISTTSVQKNLAIEEKI